MSADLQKGEFALYDLVEDPAETTDLSATEPEVMAEMKAQFLAWDATMEASFAGKDYPGGTLSPPDPEPIAWYETDRYRPYEAVWRERWEFLPYYQGTKGFGIGKGKGNVKAKGKEKSK